MMIGLELIFSKKDSDDKSDMVKEGIKTKSINGTRNGHAPLGFKNTPEKDRGQRHWVVDEERFMLLQKVFKEFLTGRYSANKVSEYARDVLKLTTPTHKVIGGKLVSPQYINLVLKNPIYAGFFYYDDARCELDKKYPRIITEEEHYKIISMIEGRNITKTGKSMRRYFLMSFKDHRENLWVQILSINLFVIVSISLHIEKLCSVLNVN